MRDSLAACLQLQVDNEAAVRSSALFEFEGMVKLAAVAHTAQGRTVDPERIKECKDILKRRASLLSNFRGNVELAVLAKMALADDPEAYLDDVMDIYDQLTQHRVLASEAYVLAAMTIRDNCPPEWVDAVVDDTLELYRITNERHRAITDDYDVAFFALMAVTGKGVAAIEQEAEDIYQWLRDHYHLPRDSMQAFAQVLSLSDAPVSQKVDRCLDLYGRLKSEDAATGKGKEIAIYAAFADLEVPTDDAATEIGEADQWLAGKKGYGIMGVGSSLRRMMAANLALLDRAATSGAALGTSAVTATSQVVLEQVILALVLMICVTTMSAAASSAAN